MAPIPLVYGTSWSLSWQEQRVPYPKLDLSAQELQECFQQQLQMELGNTVTIESVESTKPITPKAIEAVKLRGLGRRGSVQALGPVGGAGLSDLGLLPGDTHCSILPLCAARTAGHASLPVARRPSPGPAEVKAQHVQAQDDVGVQHSVPIPVPAAR